MSRAHKMTTSRVINDYLQDRHVQVLKMWINELHHTLLLTQNRHERIDILREIGEFKSELRRVVS